MTLIKINLFGKFSARRAEHSLAGLEVFRTQELFTYLLVNRDRPHTREALATLLWVGIVLAAVQVGSPLRAPTPEPARPARRSAPVAP